NFAIVETGTRKKTSKKSIRLRNLLNYIAVLLFGVGLLAGCDSSQQESGSRKISEGKIVYTLSYPQFDDDNIFTSMFPSEMTFKFKDNNTRNELKTNLAIFSTSLLANNKDKKVTHLVKIADKYSGLEMDSMEIMEEYGRKPDGMKITPSDKTKEIAGYNCNHAYVTFENDASKNFDVYYTNDIEIQDPNWCTPFHEIKGVLMEAKVNKFSIDMHIIANAVVEEEYPNEDFQITNEYEPITVAEMADIFQSF
ncbi:MAG: GLPGLI family protein, partial [Bacteroidia bacterium]